MSEYPEAVKKALAEQGITFNQNKPARPELMVYGAGCTWFDTIDKAGSQKMRDGMGRLPICPHCGSVLFQMTMADWAAGVDKQEAKEPGYRELMKWAQGRCYKNFDALKEAFRFGGRPPSHNPRAG